MKLFVDAWGRVEPSVVEVVVWLREQGAGEERHTMEVGGVPVLFMTKPGWYLVVPLDTEPPKGTQ